MTRGHWSIVLLAGILLAACGTSSTSGSLPGLAVRPSDLLGGMVRASTSWWTNRQAAKRDGISPAAYDRHGRLRSYDVRFERGSGSTRTDLQGVESEVAVYRSTAGAHWAFEQARFAVKRGYMWGSTTLGTHRGLARVSVPFTVLPIPPVGTDRAGYTSTWGGDEFAYTTCVALFWRGNHAVRLQVTAILGHAAIRTIDTLARTIDRRLIRDG
jgi:hypothetical protein